MNRYTWIWFWRNTVVPEMKGLFWIAVVILFFIAVLP